jgi:hypothetical protein
LVLENGTIKRDTWTSKFGEIVFALDFPEKSAVIPVDPQIESIHPFFRRGTVLAIAPHSPMKRRLGYMVYTGFAVIRLGFTGGKPIKALGWSEI